MFVLARFLVILLNSWAMSRLLLLSVVFVVVAVVVIAVVSRSYNHPHASR